MEAAVSLPSEAKLARKAAPWPTGPHIICVHCGIPVAVSPVRMRNQMHFKKPFYCSNACLWKAKAKLRAHLVKHTHCTYCGEKLNHLSDTGFFNINKRFCNASHASRWAGSNKEIRAKVSATRKKNRKSRPRTPEREIVEYVPAADRMAVHDPFMAVYD